MIIFGTLSVFTNVSRSIGIQCFTTVSLVINVDFVMKLNELHIDDIIIPCS